MKRKLMFKPLKKGVILVIFMFTVNLISSEGSPSQKSRFSFVYGSKRECKAAAEAAAAAAVTGDRPDPLPLELNLRST
jgi:hypothetical protein